MVIKPKFYCYCKIGIDKVSCIWILRNALTLFLPSHVLSHGDFDRTKLLANG